MFSVQNVHVNGAVCACLSVFSCKKNLNTVEKSVYNKNAK